jgi:flavin-binding protein dodecin
MPRLRQGHDKGETKNMMDHVYKVVEIAGSSSMSIEDAISNAIAKASKSLRSLNWFQVIETRGHIEDGKVGHYQVVLKIGFQLDE